MQEIVLTEEAENERTKCSMGYKKALPGVRILRMRATANTV